MHRFRVNDQVKVLESYLSPCDLDIDDIEIRKGIWLLAVRILDDALWEQVKDGRLTGFTIGGSARRIAEAGDRRLEAVGGEDGLIPERAEQSKTMSENTISLLKAQGSGLTGCSSSLRPTASRLNKSPARHRSRGGFAGGPGREQAPVSHCEEE
jgi:hypothetical protein